IPPSVFLQPRTSNRTAPINDTPINDTPINDLPINDLPTNDLPINDLLIDNFGTTTAGIPRALGCIALSSIPLLPLRHPGGWAQALLDPSGTPTSLHDPLAGLP